MPRKPLSQAKLAFIKGEPIQGFIAPVKVEDNKEETINFTFKVEMQQSKEKEPTTRITVDVPKSLHKMLKQVNIKLDTNTQTFANSVLLSACQQVLKDE